MIKDKNIAGKVVRDFIRVQDMAGWLEATNLLTSLGAGTPVMQEVLAAAELAGMAIGAAGDEIYDFWKIPYKLDRDYPVAVRIIFNHASADADTPDWVVTLKGVGLQEAISDAKVSPDETLTFPAKAVAATANAVEATDWQKTGTAPFAAGDLFAQISVECNGLGSASADEISLWGIEIAYTAKRTTQNNERETTDPALDNTLA